MVIAVVGAGGKTTVGTHIGKQLAAAGRRVLFTTTTKIFMSEGEAVYLGDAAHIRAEADYMVAARRQLPSGKLEGYTPEDIGTISALGLFDDIVVEADGAARRSVKTPNETEPVYPAALDLVVGVIGLDCLGQPVSEAHVHRPELFRAVTGAQEGELVSARHLNRLISHPDGLFRHAPAAAQRVVFLNKCDTMEETAQAQAAEIVRQSPHPVMLTGYGRDWFGEFSRCFMDAQSGGKLPPSKGE
jgi:probable selenium-dependent hydroxylase accessory protein YqeC